MGFIRQYQGAGNGGRKRLSKRALIALFWSFVDKGDPKSCWLWKGKARGSYGYFQRGLSYRKEYGLPLDDGSHRFAYAAAYGSCPDHLYVLHDCDTPLCVNPNHLWLGTQTDNMQDCRSKQRIRMGGAKLTVNLVRKLRRLHKRGRTVQQLQSMLQKYYNIDIGEFAIRRVVDGERWAWVKEK